MFEYIQTSQGWVLHWGPLPQGTIQPSIAPVVEPASPSTLVEQDEQVKPILPVKQPISHTVELSC